MQKSTTNVSGRTKQIVNVGLLSGIIFLLGFTSLGFIPLPIARITIMHIPVIIGVILEGPKVGLILGFIFGATSLYQNIVTPTALSFAFYNPLVSILPRLLIPITTYYTYKFIKIKKEPLRIAIATIVGSLTNTVGVLGMIFILYLDRYAEAYTLSIGKAKAAIMSVVYTNGIVEAIVAAMLVSVIITALRKAKK